MNKVFIGVGGNLGDVIQAINGAMDELRAHPQINHLILSSFYSSTPLSDNNQPQYINMVASFETELLPIMLLDLLQGIELKFGRIRTKEQWASRTLDLDILLYADIQMSTERLTIPHAGLLERDFVLIPLREIASDLNIPGYGQLSQAIECCENRSLKKLTGKI